ncbi:MAG: FKBP-type peptidyl-prolyl cis-trans isomerase [Deltaproteobacteria bacterium]|jgi:FKBP-type peptidyl-prolyl cis-trans isomerase SlyD|nr:FKBP-type peptidyl-prolyl cis-trans isomerase [Deltaproteobacteria bacterium]
MNGQIVSFHCVLKDRLGRVISSSFNQNVSTQDSPNGQLRGFSRGMQDLKVGECRKIFVGAEEAYGFYDPSKIVELSREELPEQLRLGDVIMVGANNKEPQSHRVVGVTGELVTLDANHPLAGQDLIFEIEAVEVREDDGTEESDEEDDERDSADRGSSPFTYTSDGRSMSPVVPAQQRILH